MRNLARPHPLTLAVVRHKLKSVAEEMVDTMIRTSFSPILNQSHDLSAVIHDAEGRMLAQAERVPIHMGAMPFAVKAMMQAFEGDVHEGDILIANDPYWGGNHLPDVTLAMPVFDGGRIRLWVANRAHQGDIGGMSAGGFSGNASEIFHEGIRIPPCKLAERGRVREDLLRLIVENTRKPEDMMGDLRAQLAAVHVGVDRMRALFERYGADEIDRCSAAILDAAEAAMRAQFRRWKPGVYKGESLLDDDGRGNRRIPVRATVTIEDDHATVDLTDSADQLASFVNSPYANTAACVYVAFMYMATDDQTHNEGCFRPIRIITRKGSICDPLPPAPVVGSSVLTSTVIMEAVMKAMEKAAPADMIAGYARRFRFAIAGKDREGRSYIWHYFANRGGAGATTATDGWPNLGVIHNPGGARSPSVERTESSFPFLIESFALRPDSGGAGTTRGGLGGVYRLRYEGAEPAILNAAGEGVEVGPYGVAGGAIGACHDYRIEGARGERRLGTKESGVVIETGDVVVCRSAGGGGFGDPARRDPARIAADRADGYVTG